MAAELGSASSIAAFAARSSARASASSDEYQPNRALQIAPPNMIATGTHEHHHDDEDDRSGHDLASVAPRVSAAEPASTPRGIASRGERLGRDRPRATVTAFHAAAATAANTASDARGRGGARVVDDRDLDRRCVLGPDHAERADREVVHLAGRRRSTARPSVSTQPERHVGRADAVRAQHDLVERVTGRDPHLDPLERARAPDRRAHARRRSVAARLGHGHVSSSTARSRSSRTSTGRSTPGFAERALEQHGVLGEREARGSRPGPSAATRGTPGASHCSTSSRRAVRASTALAAIGGRFGPSRTHVLAARTRPGPVGPSRSASSRAAAGASDATLPPNAPPFASGDAGSPPGHAPRRVGLEVRRLDPARREPHTAGRARRAAEAARRRRSSCAVPAPCPRARARFEQRLGRRPSARPRPRPRPAVEPGGSGTATSASRGAPSSAKPPSPSGTSGPTRCAAPPSSAARRGGGVEVAATGCRPTAAPTPAHGASCTVFQPVHRQRCAASARSTSTATGGPLRRAAPRRARRSRACRSRTASRRVATNASASRSRTSGVESFDRRDRAGRRPGRPASRTRPAPRRRRAPCSSRTDPAARSRPSPTRCRAARAAPRAATRPARRRPSTGAPLHVKRPVPWARHLGGTDVHRAG